MKNTTMSTMANSWGKAWTIVLISLSALTAARGASQEDFVTGGGNLITNEVKAVTFAVVGGLKSGEYWGSLNYKTIQFPGLAEDLTVKSTDLLTYCDASVPGTKKRILVYSVRVNNIPGYLARIIVSEYDVPPFTGHPGWEMDTVVYDIGASLGSCSVTGSVIFRSLSLHGHGNLRVHSEELP